jgi:hypothetical protein
MKLGVATISFMMLAGCAGTSTRQNAITAGSYEAQQLACVDNAKTSAEATACRCEVKARYGRPCAGSVAP